MPKFRKKLGKYFSMGQKKGIGEEDRRQSSPGHAQQLSTPGQGFPDPAVQPTVNPRVQSAYGVLHLDNSDESEASLQPEESGGDQRVQVVRTCP